MAYFSAVFSLSVVLNFMKGFKNDKFIIFYENADEINWSDKEELNNRLYHVIKFTLNKIYLGKSNVANIKADKDLMPIKLACNSNTIKAVKVKLDILGNIIWRSDIGHILK